MAEKPVAEVNVTPLSDKISLQLAEETHERFRALHARLSRYEGLIEKKDARIAELEEKLKVEAAEKIGDAAPTAQGGLEAD